MSIVEPQVNQTYTDDLVRVAVHFRADAISGTFRAQVNGVEISSLFQQIPRCQSSGVCDVEAYVRRKDLLHGANAVSVEVNGPEEIVADDRVKFQYEAPGVQTTPVSKLTPSVAVWSVWLEAHKSAEDYKNYDIVVGPGPNFPQVIYKASDLSCDAGLNSVQVLVLQRKTLSPESTNGRKCFSNAIALATFLRAVPLNDLVILNNFLGHMPNIDTTAIGGTNYSGATFNTNYYSAIGVAGAPKGTAYESFQPNASHTPRLGRQFLPPLAGSLMLDTASNYSFAPKDFPELKIVPGIDGNCATATLGSRQIDACLSSGIQGGVWIVAVDRLLGNFTDQYFLHTNSNNEAERKAAVADLTYLLDAYYKSNDLLAITTVGTAFRRNTEVTAGLWNSINRLGGNGFVLPQLIGAGTTYTLITSPDPAFIAARMPRESTPARASGTGKLDVVLGRDRKNQFGLYQDYPGGVLTAFSGNEWPSTIFEQPRDWPAWTGGQQKAYDDLTSTEANYPTLRAALGCSRSCQPIREYYASNISTCIPPPFLAFSFSTLPYKANVNYTEEDFRAVTRQLATELGYEGNIYSLCGVVRQLTDSQKATLQKQLESVGNSINSSLQKKALDAQLSVDALAKYSKIASVGSSLPVIGAAFSATSATLSAAAVMVPTDAGVPGEFTYTLKQLQDRNNTVFGDRLTLLITNLFTAISNDWGKLSTIGDAYGSQEAPWYFCPNCTEANLPLNALPLISLGAKRSYYAELLPTVYSIDFLVELTDPDPVHIVRYQRTNLGYVCWVPYGGAPKEGIWRYPSINKPATSDVYIMTETKKVRSLGFDQLNFPTAGLMSDLLNAPSINLANVSLSGGAGLITDDFLRAGSNLNLRAGYYAAPSTLCKGGSR